MNPVIFQTAIVTPFLLLLAAYTVTRGTTRPEHRHLSLLLVSMSAWCVCLAITASDAPFELRKAARDFARLFSCIMTPVAVLTIGHFSRLEFFERTQKRDLIIASPFAIFFVAFATNDYHHLMIRTPLDPREVADVIHNAGPFFWGFQVWAYAYIGASIFMCAYSWHHTRSKEFRQSMLLIVGAVIFPMVAHTVFLLDLLPIRYTLTPASLAFTALFLVLGIQNAGLLERRPVVRRDVIDYLSDGLVLADADGLVIDANPAAATFLGIRDTKLRGVSIEEVLEALDPDHRFGGLLDDSADSERERWPEIETSGGKILQVHSVVLGAKPGQPAGRFLVLRDRTSERRGERLLRQRQKMESVGVLAAGVAHEVNNPLAFVRANLGHAQQIAKTVGSPDSDAGAAKGSLCELWDVLDESVEGLDRISAIVDGLLRFSRLPSEGWQRIDVAEVIEEAIQLATLQRMPSLEIVERHQTGLPPIKGDPNRLVQVVLNLLINAKHALGGVENGRIVVESDMVDDCVEIRVRDNGPGVPEELHDRIFDPFFTTRRPGEGTGLGLSIAFDIVREHDGNLELCSRPDEGACFSIRIPADEDEAEGVRSADPA